MVSVSTTVVAGYTDRRRLSKDNLSVWYGFQNGKSHLESFALRTSSHITNINVTFRGAGSFPVRKLQIKLNSAQRGSNSWSCIQRPGNPCDITKQFKSFQNSPYVRDDRLFYGFQLLNSDRYTVGWSSLCNAIHHLVNILSYLMCQERPCQPSHYDII